MVTATKIRLNRDEKQVIHYLRIHGSTCRSDIALSLGWSNFSLTQISKGLLALGLIEEAASRGSQRRGRPSVPLQISPAGGYAVGVAIHGGLLDIALVDYTGSTITHMSEPFDSPEPVVFVSLLRSRMNELAGRHRLLGTPLLGVGIGLPGYSRPGGDSQRWHGIDALSGWRDVPVAQMLEDELGVPVWIENDANAAALAEYYLGGLLSKFTSAVVILLGHGIGAGIVADGRLLKGEYGSAGEIGVFYPGSPRPCTLDLLAFLRENGVDIWSVSDVEAMTQAHGELIQRWMLQAAGQLELVLNMAQAWFNPGAIVISSPLPHWFVEQLVTCINETVASPFQSLAHARNLGVSKLGGTAIALGAALVPIHASVEP